MKKDKYLDQDSLLELQRELAPRTRISDIFLTVLTLLIIFGFSIAFWIMPDRTFSEEENRALQTVPAISSPGKVADRLIDGRFTAEIAEYYADQFPLRDVFVEVKAATELLLGKRENNSVIYAENGYIIDRSDPVSDAVMADNTAAIVEFAARCEALGVTFDIAAAPRSADALSKYMPQPAPESYTDEIRSRLSGDFSGLGFIDLYDRLTSAVNEGEYVYYRTDHHWTTLGAYYGYLEIMSAMGMEAQPLDRFTPELASDEFYGTTWSSAGMRWVDPDEIYFYRFDGDTDFTLTLEGNAETAMSGFYDREYLEKKDKYGAFLSGNNGRVTIKKNGGEDRETLLILKDSFAHSLVPFLACDYDLEIIDLRYYKKPVIDLLTEENITGVLAIYNYDSFVTESAFNLLRLGR